MNHKKACEILGIDINNITSEIVKRQYKKKALIYHPDKNRSADAAIKFQEIHDAYQFLIQTPSWYQDIQENIFAEFKMEHDLYESMFEGVFNDVSNEYNNILFSFLGNVIGKDVFNGVQNKIFYMIIQKLCDRCEGKAIELLEKLDKSILLKIYEILELHQEVFHFSTNFLTLIRDIVHKKTSKDECILLYTFLEDLLADNLYKLTENGNRYIIPLWHHELVYDNAGSDLYIKCVPLLPDNMKMDEHNNLNVWLKYNIADIWEKESFLVVLGKKDFLIWTKELKMQKEQIYILGGQGISKINTKDIYDVGKRGDIILHIELHI